jgi:hypothetical protein
MMKPGAYVVGRHLAMKGLAKLGVHQFIVVVPEHPKQFGYPTKDLGDGTIGIVIGAYVVSGRLKSETFAPSDLEAIRLFVTSGTSRVPGIQVETVNLEKSICWLAIDFALQKIMRTAMSYNSHEADKPVNYPKGLIGQLGNSCRNSNTWAQTVIEVAMGKNAVLEDFDGFDLCHDKRIDSTYFDPD